MPLIKCRGCGQEIDPNAAKCPNCSSEITPSFQCQRCGEEVYKPGTCPHCGAKTSDFAVIAGWMIGAFIILYIVISSFGASIIK